MKNNTLAFSLLFHALVFCFLHAHGVLQGIEIVSTKSSGSEISSFISSNGVFEAPTILYLLQFAIILATTISLFIYINSKFAIYFSDIPFIKKEMPNKKQAIMIWGGLSNFILFILNAAYFQHSKHLTNIFNFWPENHLSTLVCWVLFLIPLTWFSTTILRNLTYRLSISITLALLIAIFNNTYSPEPKISPLTENEFDKPHIIFIGVDSLRSDLLPSHMPFLYEQLKKSIIFDNSYTELGRTFPAWNTILTGMYPPNHGARINLIPEKNLTEQENYLPHILKQSGYKTIFAYDETRFANIGKYQGFDQVISPRIGASDFLIGLASDIPIINLLSLSQTSRLLLPEIYSNRAVHHTYRPDSFTQLISQSLTSANQPTFFAAHFCLAHWPYTFSGLHHPEYSYPQPYYPSNLRAVDDQIKTLMDTLKTKGYLNNTKIVFLSDHGESWTSENPIFTSDIEKRGFMRQIGGHGSDLVTDTANRVLLALQNFSKEQVLLNNTRKITSLADITPTVLDELKITNNHTDGLSFLQTSLPENRWIPIETGTVFDIESMSSGTLLDTISPMLNRYAINSDGRVVIKASQIPLALKQKRYGIRNNKLILTEESDGMYLFDTSDNTFIRFHDLASLKRKNELLFNQWCKWYKKQSQECP